VPVTDSEGLTTTAAVSVPVPVTDSEPLTASEAKPTATARPTVTPRATPTSRPTATPRATPVAPAADEGAALLAGATVALPLLGKSVPLTVTDEGALVSDEGTVASMTAEPVVGTLGVEDDRTEVAAIVSVEQGERERIYLTLFAETDDSSVEQVAAVLLGVDLEATDLRMEDGRLSVTLTPARAGSGNGGEVRTYALRNNRLVLAQTVPLAATDVAPAAEEDVQP
jgi:hypothetical protein